MIICRTTKYGFWLRSAAFGLLDQASYSVANFLVAILLARSLSRHDYGAYTLAFLIWLLIAGVHSAVILEPFTVFGAVKYRACFGSYFAAVVKWTVAGTVAIGLSLVACSGLGLFPPRWIGNAVGLAIAVPALLLAWILRYAFYVTGTPRDAVRSSLIQSVLTLTGVYLALRYLILSGLVAFVATAVGALGGAFIAWMRLRHRVAASLHEPFDERSALRDHWRYGRWVLLTTVPSWTTGNGVFVLAAAFLTLADVGALQAIGGLMTPVPVMMSALGAVLLPSIVTRHAERGTAWLEPAVSRVSMLLGLLAAITLMPFVVFGPRAVQILYEGKYADYVWLMGYLVMQLVIGAVAGGFRLGLRSLEASHRIFISYAISALCTMLIGTAGVMIGGLRGLVAGMVLAQTILLTALWIQWRRALSARQQGLHPSGSDLAPAEIRVRAEGL
jgi:O-antigen/teichoic acid export membrane protein